MAQIHGTKDVTPQATHQRYNYVLVGTDTVAIIEANHHFVKQAVERDSDLKAPTRKPLKNQKSNRHKNERHSGPLLMTNLVVEGST
jgi:hypothetical protein